MNANHAGPDPPVAFEAAALVRRSLDGDATASEALVRRFERPIFNLIVRLVGDPATAEDLTQDTFLKMFRALDSYNPAFKFSSWIFRIAHNTTVDYLRQRRLLMVAPTVDAEGDEHDPVDRIPDLAALSPEQSTLRAELIEALDGAIDRLRPEYRAAVVLRYQEGLDYQEIADAMELPLGTVKTYLHRARRELAGDLSTGPWALKPRPAGGRKA